MWGIEDVTMSLTKAGGLQFRTAVEWKRRVLLQLLQRVTMGENIRITPNSLTVKRGGYLSVLGGNGKPTVFFPYMIGKGTYGLYIVDFEGLLMAMLMKPGGIPVQHQEVQWLNQLTGE